MLHFYRVATVLTDLSISGVTTDQICCHLPASSLLRAFKTGRPRAGAPQASHRAIQLTPERVKSSPPNSRSLSANSSSHLCPDHDASQRPSGTGFAAGIQTVHDHHPFAALRGLLFALPPKFAKAHIRHHPGQLVIFLASPLHSNPQ